MRRIFISVFLLVALAGGIAVAPRVTRPAVGPLITAGASDVLLRAQGLGRYELSYHAIGMPYAWYDEVVRNLTARGWRDSNPWRPYGNYPTYITAFSVGPILVQDEIDVRGEANTPTMTLRRRLWLRWP